MRPSRPTRPTPDVLRDRCAAASLLVEQCAVALAEASTRMLSEPGSLEARLELEDAEQLHYLALHERRSARRALRRGEAIDFFLARWALVPWPARARRR